MDAQSACSASYGFVRGETWRYYRAIHPCLEDLQYESLFFLSHSLCLLPVPPQPSSKAISRTDRCPSSSFTAASGSIFITRSITKPNCDLPPPSRTRARRAPVQL